MASCSPVDAPEGTAARPTAPPSTWTSASTVGLPRESMISRPWILVIFVDMRLLCVDGVLCDEYRNRFGVGGTRRGWGGDSVTGCTAMKSRAGLRPAPTETSG